MDSWGTRILYFVLISNAYSQQFFNTMPPPVNTNFTCRGRDTGFYADVETNCRVYHTCDDHGNKFTYYCPAETAFRQESLVCDHAHLVDCANGRRISRVEDNKNREKSEKKIEGKISNDSPDFFQPGNSNSAYTRSFRITPGPPSQFPTTSSSDRRQPTFVLSSSVFLRDRKSFKNSPTETRILKNFNDSVNSSNGVSARTEDSRQGFSTISSSPSFTTTYRPFGADFKVKNNNRDPTDLRSSKFDKEAPTEEYFDKFTSATTSRSSIPFGGNHQMKFNDEENNNGNSPSKMYQNSEKMNANKTPIRYQFDEKRRNEKKIESGGNFRDHSTNSEKDDQFFNQGKMNARNVGFTENLPKDPDVSRNLEKYDKNVKSFDFDSGNFPYSETLRSMQAATERSLQPPLSYGKLNYSNFPAKTTTYAPPTTAGTEFPVHSFAGSVYPAGPNELDDDPYYPKRSTTTETYYKLRDYDKEGKKSLRFSTRTPWPGSLNFEIPEVLPDLNTLDDLVDRRKLFYIARAKNT